MSSTVVYNGTNSYIELWHQLISQNITLAGQAAIRIRFEGNGVDYYLVESAYIVQGTKTVTLVCNNQTAFYVPSFGRWSDLADISDFTAGAATVYAIVKLKVPILIPQSGGTSAPGIVKGVDDSSGGKQLFLTTFNTDADPAIRAVIGLMDEVSKRIPSYAADTSTTPSLTKIVDNRLKLIAGTLAENGGYVQWDNITVGNAWTIHFRMIVHGIPEYLGVPGGGTGHIGETFSLKFGYPTNMNVALVYNGYYSSVPGRAVCYLFIRDSEAVSHEHDFDDNPGILEDTDQHYAFVFDGTYLHFFIDGVKKHSVSIPNGMSAEEASFWITCWNDISTGDASRYISVNWVEFLNYAAWTEDFTPPTTEPVYNPIPEIISLHCTGKLTVTDNSEVLNGDTLTINGVVYTFVTLPGSSNHEIVIGPNSEITKSNITAVIDGAQNATISVEDLAGVDACTGGTASGLDVSEEWPAADAFDDDEDTDCYGTTAIPNWIKYDFGVGAEVIAKKYSVQSWDEDEYYISGWTFEGSNDDINWDVLDTQSGQISDTPVEYEIDNEEPYRYYRWNITEVGSGGLDVRELEIIEDDTLSVSVLGETASWSTTSTGIHLTDFVQQISYECANVEGTLPVLSASGSSTERGDLGDYYAYAEIPRLTASGATVNDSRGAVYAGIPMLTSSGFGYYTASGVPATDALKLAFLHYLDTWFQSICDMLFASTEDDDLALEITQFVAGNISYVSDLINYGVVEFWADPRMTLINGSGDCEDFALLLGCLMLNAGIEPSRVRVYFGTYNDVGHAWVLYRRAIDEKWINLDATKGY